MILAALLLPVAVAAIVFAIQRLRLPAFLAVMIVVVAYGLGADMTWQSVGRAFGLGFASAMEQTGLLVVAGSLAARASDRRMTCQRDVGLAAIQCQMNVTFGRFPCANRRGLRSVHAKM